MSELCLSGEAQGNLEAIEDGMAIHGVKINKFLNLWDCQGVTRVVAKNHIALWLQRGAGDVETYLRNEGYVGREISWIARWAIQNFERMRDFKILA